MGVYLKPNQSIETIPLGFDDRVVGTCILYGKCDFGMILGRTFCGVFMEVIIKVRVSTVWIMDNEEDQCPMEN